MHTYIHVYMHTSTHTHAQIPMHKHPCARTHAHMHMFTHAHVHMHVPCTCTCPACTCTCTGVQAQALEIGPKRTRPTRIERMLCTHAPLHMHMHTCILCGQHGGTPARIERMTYAPMHHTRACLCTCAYDKDPRGAPMSIEDLSYMCIPCSPMRLRTAHEGAPKRIEHVASPFLSYQT